IKSKVSVADHITIAGQTAPGEGVTVYGNGISFSGSYDIIVRYIRFRGSLDMSKGTCTVTADNASTIIFDHVSIEWGRWDNLHVKNSSNITLQYCMIGEGIDAQGFGAILESPVNLPVHHCLWINNTSRDLKAKAGIEFINNVIYNWGSNGFVGGHSAAKHYQDIVGNYFIAGPNSTGRNYINLFTSTDYVYQKGNYVDLNKDGKLNGKLVMNEDFRREKATIRRKPWAVSYNRKEVETASEAYRKVVKTAGASLYRDPVDSIMIHQAASLGLKGKNYVHDEKEASNLQALEHSKPVVDTDGDGIPDQWEMKNGLNPENSEDGKRITDNGYSNLEIYFHSIITTPSNN